ncbi:MAG: lipoyl synthase [Desulfobulbus propionicus]|nr:MAG: lipoyl synthase [Desulfobulbus propionicus]
MLRRNSDYTRAVVETQVQSPQRAAKPGWLKRKLPSLTGSEYEKIRRLLKRSTLNTVCQEAMCPNQFECYGRGTATFLILGNHCSRNCRFCAVAHGPFGPPDVREPGLVAEAVAAMQLRYAVITSVTRDDLADGGSSHFAKTIKAIREKSPATLIEVLIPDFQGCTKALETVIASRPDVLNHNMETVERLYPAVRPQAVYQRSLDLLQQAKEKSPALITKSGVMVGLGETRQELSRTFHDLAEAHCDILTMGQYLQPSKEHLQVERFVPPGEFARLKDEAVQHGFAGVAAAPFVRSSYKAEELYQLAR